MNKKLKLAFLDTIGLRYNGDTLKERGLGGSESAIIYLGQELTKIGFEVYVFNKCDKEGVYDGVKYIDISNAKYNTEKFDILITSRTVLPYVPIIYRDTILRNYNGYDIAEYKPLVDSSAYKVMWLHDTFILGEEWVEDVLRDNDYQEIFTLSDWHSQYIPNAKHGQQPRHYESMKRKIYQTRNGVKSFYDEVNIAAKDPNLFIYNASTTKGMVPLLDTIWPRVNDEFPEAKLLIIGGYYPNNAPTGLDQIEQLWHEKKKENNGKRNVTFTGIITQKEIADILLKASYFIYPGAFPETFGISVTEALNYNVPVIATRFGALDETTPESTSYLIDYPITRNIHNYNERGSVADEDQANRFMEIVRKAYTDPYLRQQKMYAANEFKPFLGWDTVALQWKEHFYNKLGLFLDIEELKEIKYRSSRLHTLYKRRFYNVEDMIEDYSIYNKNEIVVISPVYNAEKYIENNILSVAHQLYNNYQHIIIDDLSSDKTVEIAQKTIENLPEKIRNKFKLIINKDKKYAVGNQVETIKSLQNKNSIIALLDGDDWLVNDPYIFEFINREYEKGANFTYGSCHSICDNIDLIAQNYPKEILLNKKYKEHKFNWTMPYTHLRTFRKSLFDKVDESNFKDENGNYWKAGGDNSLFYPLIELCQPEEIKNIQKVLVMYNDDNPLNDYKINNKEQVTTMEKITNSVKTQKTKSNLLGIDADAIQKIREDKTNKSLNKELKEILENREDVWVDEEEALNIRIRIDWILSKLGNAPKNIKILDIGSWTGTVANAIYNNGFNNITCLDISSKVVELGSEKFPELKWIQGDIEKFYTSEKFDVIIAAEIIEHLINPFEAIEKMKKLLNKNGFILFTIPSPRVVFQAGSHEHISSLSKEDLEKFTNEIEIVTGGEDGYEWSVGIIRKDFKQIDNKIKNILIAIPTAKNIETDTFLSIYRLKKPDNVNIHLECFFGYNIDQVRNLIANYAIINQFDYVFFVDSDMILPSDSLLKLLNANKDIISGIYVQRRPGQQIAEIHLNGLHITDPEFFKGKDIVEVDSVGFGAVLVKTEVLKNIGYPQFTYHHTLDFKDTISEDTDFCLKAAARGYKINILTNLLYEHIATLKMKWQE